MPGDITRPGAAVRYLREGPSSKLFEYKQVLSATRRSDRLLYCRWMHTAVEGDGGAPHMLARGTQPSQLSLQGRWRAGSRLWSLSLLQGNRREPSSVLMLGSLTPAPPQHTRIGTLCGFSMKIAA